MKLPRDIHGRELVAVLCRDWGYRVVHQAGSHIILETDTPAHHRVSVPAHKPLRIGTLNAILRSVAAAKQCMRETILAGL